MSDTTDFEGELLKLFRAYGASEYQRGDHDAVARIMRAAGAEVNATRHSHNGGTKEGTTKAPKGAARAFLKEFLGPTRRGIVWGEIEEAAKKSGVVSHWAVRKELDKGHKVGRYELRSGRWVLKEREAS